MHVDAQTVLVNFHTGIHGDEYETFPKDLLERVKDPGNSGWWENCN
jgi:hypothetical protein